MALTGAERQARWYARHGTRPERVRRTARRLAAEWMQQNEPELWAEFCARAEQDEP